MYKTSPSRYILLLLCGLLVLGGCEQHDSDLQQLDATVFTQPRPLPDFTLVDQNNRAFTPARLRHKWSFLFFGYTHCPDICPNTLTTLNIIATKLHEPDVQFVFVSVDPYRDKPATLAKYVSYFNANFIGVTENKSGELAKLTGKLGVMYKPVPNGGERDDYLVQHSANLILIDPNGKWQALLSPPFDAQKIVREFKIIQNHYIGK